MKAGFLFKGGRRARLADPEPGPREFFYGFTEMAARGIEAGMVEEGDLGDGLRPALVERAATRVAHALVGLNAQTLARLGGRRAREALDWYDVLVATTNAQGLALAALKELGLLRARVLLLAMGLLPLDAPAHLRRVQRRLLRRVALAPISRREADWLAAKLGDGVDVAYLPFGVDTGFWTPGDGATEDYVLAIGNDPRRDWATLAAAWKPDYPPLRLVTRRPVPLSAGRIEVIRGDWTERALTDSQVRDLYRKARFVVLPIEETIQPSGQSACLQAMACGKAVIFSRISGLWEPDLLIDGGHWRLIAPGDAAALGVAVEDLLADAPAAAAMGARARDLVGDRFTVERMAEAMAARLEALR